MKKLVFLIALIFLTTGLYAQFVVDITFNFKAKTENPLQRVKDFYSMVGFEYNPKQNTYSGLITNIKTRRESKFIRQYQADTEIYIEIKKNKVFVRYGVKSVNEKTIECDKKHNSYITEAELDNEIGKKVYEVLEDITEYLRDYVNNERESGDWMKYFIGFDLDYIVEDNSVSYYKVLKSKRGQSKEELFNILKAYFTYAYGSGKAVIEDANPDTQTIMAKGIYPEVHIYQGWSLEKYDIPHVVRIECRDGRARVVITIGNYDITSYDGPLTEKIVRNIAHYKPFGSKRDVEMDNALEELEKRIRNQFYSMQKAIDDGNTNLDTIDEW